jgi:hypothetical protein
MCTCILDNNMCTFIHLCICADNVCTAYAILHMSVDNNVGVIHLHMRWDVWYTCVQCAFIS